MIIDAHLHVWDLARARYPWLGPDAGDLNRTHSFDEIAPTLTQSGIDAVVLVQASDEAADTELMLEVAATHPEVLGVVAWSPLDDPEGVERDLERFAGLPVVGIRNLVQERPRSWLMQPAVGEGLEVLAARAVPLDIPTNGFAVLADVIELGERHPGLTIVIDHLAKPPIGGSPAQAAEWRELMSRCAQNPRTVAKVSGLYGSVGGLAEWTTESVRPFVEHALEVFGADRLLYGGDWPVADLAGGYSRTWSAVSSILSGLSAGDRDAILGGTAAKVYGLGAVT